MKTLILFLFVLLFIPNCKTERKYLNQGTIKIIFTFDNKSNKLDINKSMNCLSSRLEKYCGLKPSLLKVKGFFQFSVSGSIDSMTLKNLFLLKGTFGLWDTYDYTDIIQMLDKANSLIGRLNLVKRFTDNNDSLYSFDQKRYPLYNKLVPLLKTNGTLREGPHAGLALMQDTALIDSVLKLPSIKNLFYKDLLFLWYAYPTVGYYLLIPLKTYSKIKAPIDNGMINSVSIKKEADGKDLLYIKLKNGYFNRLDTLTMFSLRRYLVSTIDNHVFSIDKQMYVSENGEIFLHCIQGITQEQLKLLESILSFGELQLIPKIRSIYVEKY